ncbi:MAG TPA: aminotransferase class III-fold pyridoxal phosphate-dependent enzyme, partial [Pirellulales bacterium]
MADSPIVAAFRRATPGSERAAVEAAEVFPSGITHDSRRLDPYPLCVTRASGSRKWDVDGREYVDYSGGHGALLLGHNHQAVAEALRQQLEIGTHFGACHELERRWGRLVQELVPTADRVRFTASGTEATLLAIRLARAFTGKPKIIRFLGHFHGWHDHMAFGVTDRFDGSPSPGVLADVAEQIVLVPPNDPDALREALDAHRDVAAVIVEPTGGSWGQVPLPASFHTPLRELTAERNVLLIFDEVITGFRCAPGGAQEVLGVRPNLSTFAKIVAGGLPGGAVAGRAEILDQLAFASGPERKVPHQGTFNANPLSAAAGVATLEIVRDENVCQRANDYAARLREELQRVVVDAGLDWCVYGTYSGFHIFTNPDGLSVTPDEINAGKLAWRQIKHGKHKSLHNALRLAMNLHGVDVFSWI